MADVVKRADRLDRTQWIEVAVPEAARLFRRVYEAYFARLDINLTQALLIGQLDVAKGQTLNQTELARLIGMRKAAIGTAIDGLVVREFIARSTDPNDGRAKLVSLTAKGRELAVSVDEGFGELAAASRRNITREQRRMLVSILQSMCTNLEKFESDIAESDGLRNDVAAS